MPGLEDRYLVKLTVNELQDLLTHIEFNGGIAYQNDLFSGNYKDLDNAPKTEEIVFRNELKSELAKLEYVTLNELEECTKNLENKFNGIEEEENIQGETWIINKAPTSYFKSEIEFISNNNLYSSIEYKKDTNTGEGYIPHNMLLYETSQVGSALQTPDTEINWVDPNFKIIQFTKEKPTGDLLKWLESSGTIKGPHTFQGLFNYVNKQDNKILKEIKDKVTQIINNSEIPLASESTPGLVKLGGRGISIDKVGRIYATGDIIADVDIPWTRIINTPSTVEEVHKDSMCQAIISSLPTSSQTGNYMDLNNIPNFDIIYARLDTVPESYKYKLPTATSSQLGGVMIDNDTIGIINQKIYVKKYTIDWITWTAT